MGIFFQESKKVDKKEFKKTLRDIPQLSSKERSYVEDVFQKSLKGGLSKLELKKEIKRLNRNSKDPLSPLEVKKIKRKLMEKL